MEVDAISSAHFGGVEGFIGASDEFSDAFIGEDFCDTAAKGNLEAMSFGIDGGLRDAEADLVHDFGGLLQVRWQENCEFFAAVAGDLDRLREILLESRCDFAEDGVAGGVTVGIVHFLEVVDIDDGKGEFLLVLSEAFELAVEFLIEGAAIGESGESIGPSFGEIVGDFFGLAFESYFGGIEACLQLGVGVHDLGEEGLDLFTGALIPGGLDMLVEVIELGLVLGDISGDFIGPTGEVLEEEEELVGVHTHGIGGDGDGATSDPGA